MKPVYHDGDHKVYADTKSFSLLNGKVEVIHLILHICMLMRYSLIAILRGGHT